MSSTNLTDQLSKAASIASKVWTVARTVSSPLKLGALSVGTVFSWMGQLLKWLVKSPAGRVVSVVLIVVVTLSLLRHQFTAVERMKWESAVDKKEQVIVKKVTDINAETRHAQEIARQQSGYVWRIFAVIREGIFKVQPPHPIEAETIDLINETRGRQGAPR